MSRRILVVEDSLTVRKLLEIAFAPVGLVLDFACSGAEGIERARAATPDAILLDYVLPDMRGVDVCQALAAMPEVAARPIVVMSGRAETIRPRFAGFPVVVDFVSKPFSPAEIVERIGAALDPAARRPAPATAAPLVGPDNRERAARAIYARIKDRLAQIPAWLAGLGAAEPAPFLARRLLTPDVVDGMAQALAPLLRTDDEPDSSDALEPAAILGDAAAEPPLDLLRALAITGQSGELAVDRRVLHIHKGSVVLATALDPDIYLGGCSVAGVPAAARARAEAEQRQTGRPLLIRLAEEGHLDRAGADALVQDRTRALVADVVTRRTGAYSFRPGAPPPWATRHGRPVAVADIVLDELRRAPAAALVDQAVPSLDVVIERAGGFSRRLRTVELEPDERALLALVDGASDVARLLERSRLPPADGLAILARLLELGLVRRRASAGVRAALGRGHGPVAIVAGGDDGFGPTLAELLGRRGSPARTLQLAPDRDAVVAAVAARPSLLVVDAQDPDGVAAALAVAFTASAELGDVPLVAVLDARDPARAGDLERLGYDRVLVKPVHVGVLEALLARAA